MLNALGRILVKLFAAHTELHPSEQCAHCGSQLARELDEPVHAWRCLNPDCPPEVLRRLTLWVSPEVMDIQNCDAAVLKQLVERGLVRDAADFYRLNPAELTSLEGMSTGPARALVDAIEASKQREAWRVLFGLGIPQLGGEEAKALCGHFDSLQDLFAAARERLLELEGISETTARQLKRWLGDPVNRKLVRRLERAGVNFKC